MTVNGEKYWWCEKHQIHYQPDRGCFFCWQEQLLTTGKVETPIERATRYMPSEVSPVELFGDMFRTE